MEREALQPDPRHLLMLHFDINRLAILSLHLVKNFELCILMIFALASTDCRRVLLIDIQQHAEVSSLHFILESYLLFNNVKFELFCR